MANNIVAIYAGRFHPFHKGHKAVYDSLVGKFGADRVFIATSGKQNDTDSPFSFKEKAAMMMLTGVPGKAISQEVSPYKPDNVLKKFPTDTAVVFAVGQKDMDENPRFKPGLKKDGTPTYYQPLDNKKVADLDGYEKHGYLIVAPTVKFTVLDKPATSASELRARYGQLDDEQRGMFIKDLFGNYDEVIQKVMDKRLAESLIEFRVEKQSDAMKVLHNIEDRKSPFKVIYRDGTVTVAPAQARAFLNRYYRAGKDLQDEMERKVSNYFYAKKWFTLAKANEAYPHKPKFPEYGNQVFGGDKGIIVKQIKRLVNVVKELSELKKNGTVDRETMSIILSQLEQIQDHLKDTPVSEAFNKMLESLYNLNKDDPMDSEILIQGLGRMTLQQAIHRVRQYADEISKVAGSKDAWLHQGKLTHHIDMLGHYNKAVQDTYKELAKIRKKGGPRSRGIDPDLEEGTLHDMVKLNEIENYDIVEGIVKPITEEEFDKLAEKQDACYHKVKSRYKVWPSAYASGALVQCRKVGAKNWGNKSKK